MCHNVSYISPLSSLTINTDNPTSLDYRRSLAHALRAFRSYRHPQAGLSKVELCLQHAAHTSRGSVTSARMTAHEAEFDTQCTGCNFRSCVRMMDLPVRNPIRISPTCCGDCTMRNLERPPVPMAEGRPS
ncbi:hypothetical protein OE88DRAFT_974744 [Heliocybe sulcata]|uniref:Uncharacterized protein n=1 Tax=Heliocybe sulcata TaxID=5364 RepID=A0A5C3NFU6_9AGAM|nr:hypothetical protein OE88DRAFT_974744 [Heliocybe sulcata]